MKNRGSATVWIVVSVIVVVLVLLYVVGSNAQNSLNTDSDNTTDNTREETKEVERVSASGDEKASSPKVAEILRRLTDGREGLFDEGFFMARVNRVSFTDTNTENSIKGSSISASDAPEQEIQQTQSILVDLEFEKRNVDAPDIPNRSMTRFQNGDIICDVYDDGPGASGTFFHSVACAAL